MMPPQFENVVREVSNEESEIEGADSLSFAARLVLPLLRAHCPL
jgi:hypothetical protein